MPRPAVPLRHLSTLLLIPFTTLPLLSACGGGNGPSPNPNAVVTPPTGTGGSSSISMSISGTTVTVNQPVTVSATLLDAQGNPLANQVLKFSVDAALATLTPSSGTVLTDSKGVARVQLNAAGLNANGAGYVTASIKIGETDISQSQGFQIGVANVSLGDISLGSSNLSAYATTSVNVPVLINGSASATSIPVSFTSTCSQAGKATIDATVNSINGIASATYADKGCSGNDVITASVNDGSQSRQATLPVQAPAATSLQYASVSPADGVITLKGYGTAARPEAAQVKFKLVDAQGNGVAGRTLQFSLSTATGGIRFDNQQTSTTAQTNGQGEASVNVLAGSLPTPVRVVATDPSSNLITQSSGLSISSGFPDQDSVSVSLEVVNLAGWATDNVKDNITVSLADHFNNPVPDGTAVTLVANGGRISSGTTGECKTVNSTCTLSFYSQAIRPKNGRVQITAYAIGEESFTDLDGNNVVNSEAERNDVNNNPTDIGEAFIDNNENGTYDVNTDTPIDFNGNGAYDGPDHQYNGTLCSNSSSFSACSSRKFTHVYGMATLILADASSPPLMDYVSLTTGYPNYPSQPLSVSCDGSASIGLYIRDARGNILPYGSELSFTVEGASASAFTLLGGGTYKIPNAYARENARANGLTVLPITVVGPSSSDTTSCVAGKTATLTLAVKLRDHNGDFNTFGGITLQLEVN